MSSERGVPDRVHRPRGARLGQKWIDERVDRLADFVESERQDA